MNALLGLSFPCSAQILGSYLKATMFPASEETTFEQWVTNRFGSKLYNAFFKTYTEKVWGIPCTRIRAKWAAQRIKGLSLWTAVANALFKQHKSSRSLMNSTIHALGLARCTKQWRTMPKNSAAKYVSDTGSLKYDTIKGG